MNKARAVAYFAGIVDGEGHFASRTTYKTAPPYPSVHVTQKDERLMKWIVEHFGGKYCYQKGGCFQWYVYGKEATKIGKLLQPYLVVKKEQVLRVLGDYGRVGH